MTTAVTPHLNFRERAHDALVFYRGVFGGDLVLTTYGRMGQASGEDAERVIWGQVSSPDGFHIMAFDVLEPRPHDPGTNAFFVSVRGDPPAETRARWDGLLDGAEVLHPLGPAPWTLLYGMLTDRFGVTWIVDVEPQRA